MLSNNDPKKGVVSIPGGDDKNKLVLSKTTSAPAPAKSVYDPEAFQKDKVGYKNQVDVNGNITKPAFVTDPKTGKVIYTGPITKHLPALTQEIKDNQVVLNAEMKAKNRALTAEEADAALKKAGRMDYATHIKRVNDYLSLRDLTDLPRRDPNTKMEMLPDSKRYGVNENSPEGSGNAYSLQPTIPYDSAQVKLFDPYIPKNTTAKVALAKKK